MRNLERWLCAEFDPASRRQPFDLRHHSANLDYAKNVAANCGWNRNRKLGGGNRDPYPTQFPESKGTASEFLERPRGQAPL